MSWRVATVTAVHPETSTARTLQLVVPGWPGHVPGQHVDIRLTAPDGYTATRSYSIASAPNGHTFEVTVDELPDGEVSPYLVGEVVAGDKLEVRGPIGGWFVWRPEQPDPVQLVAGGSGLVPLMAMVRTHLTSHSRAPMRLLVSVREPAALFYRSELAAVEKAGPVEVTYAWTRTTPEGWPSPAGRVDAALVARAAWPPDLGATHYVCGPTGFVEAVAGLLTDAGHDARLVRTERFGPSGGNR